MAEAKRAILPVDYDDEDSSDEEDDDELFDNSKVDWRVKGNLLRGKEFSVSENGNCPRCQSNIIVFVILDELFPMGDMPEILYNLLAKGKAVLWSSQDKQSCKKSPTFMCKGFCPPDPLGAGFNINWDTVNLTKLLKDLLKLVRKCKNEQDGRLSIHDKVSMNRIKKDLGMKFKRLREVKLINQEEKDGEEEDVDEKDIIRSMLAQEKAKEDVMPVEGPLPKDDEEEKPEKDTPSSETTPAASYPVSKDGSCPHCGSQNVRYIILVKDSMTDVSLPPTLEKLLKRGKAFKMAKATGMLAIHGANSPPSFQCCSCTYGFNLDWSATNLKKIFNLDDKETTASTTTATSSTNAVSSIYDSYTAKSSYPSAGYHTSSYHSYAYTQTPSMVYPPPAVPYAYPAPVISSPGMMLPPTMGGLPPQPYGPPIPYPGPQPYAGMPMQAYGTPPFMAPGPQPMLGVPPNPYGPLPPIMGPPDPFQPPMYGNVNGPPGQQFPPNFQEMPRLRLPRGHQRGRSKNYNEKWKWTTEAAESQDQEDAREDLYDPAAATRFEQLLNKIDGDEKPPGEESQAEFEVASFTVDEKPENMETTTKSHAAIKKAEENTEPSISEAQPNIKKEIIEEETEKTVQEDASVANGASSEKVTPVAQLSEDADNNCQKSVTSEESVTSEKTVTSEESVTSEKSATSEKVKANGRTRGKTTPRGRKRQAASGRKKTAATRSTKADEDILGSEDGRGENEDNDVLSGSEEEAKKAKVVEEIVQEKEHIQPTRVTRARSLRQKK